jgi:hypothetical protein
MCIKPSSMPYVICHTYVLNPLLLCYTYPPFLYIYISIYLYIYIAHVAFTQPNPYVELRLRPEHETTGEQKQTSSIRPSTREPQWVPPELFQFVVCDMKKSRILISVYHHHPDLLLPPLPMGDCVIHTGKNLSQILSFSAFSHPYTVFYTLYCLLYPNTVF